MSQKPADPWAQASQAMQNSLSEGWSKAVTSMQSMLGQGGAPKLEFSPQKLEA